MDNKIIKHTQSLVPIGNTQLVKTNNAIEITNKLISNRIEELFNEAFVLINSKHIIRNGENFYKNFINDPNYYNLDNFKFEVDRDANYANYDKAIDFLNEIIKIDSKNKYSYLLKGISKIKTYQFEEAISDFSLAIDIDSKFVDAFKMRAKAKAESFYDSWKLRKYEVEHCNEYKNKMFTVTEYKSREHDYLGAISDLTIALEIKPNDSDLYYLRGSNNNSTGKYINAIDDFNRAVEIDPTFTKAISGRANSKDSLKEFKEAIIDYSRVIELNISNSKDLAVLVRRTWCMHELFYNKRMKEFELSLPSNIEIVKLIKSAKLLKGNLAFSKFTEVIDLYPNFGFAYVCRANSILYAGQPKEIRILDYTKAISLNQNDSFAFTCRGDENYRAGFIEAAVLDFKNAIEIDPFNSFPYFSLYMTYIRIGDTIEAIKNLNKYKEMEGLS